VTVITEETIRERLAADRAKVSRLATWEEIEYLLDQLDTWRTYALRVTKETTTLIERLTKVTQ